jgi:hypothetical protein
MCLATPAKRPAREGCPGDQPVRAVTEDPGSAGTAEHVYILPASTWRVHGPKDSFEKYGGTCGKHRTDGLPTKAAIQHEVGAASSAVIASFGSWLIRIEGLQHNWQGHGVAW